MAAGTWRKVLGYTSSITKSFWPRVTAALNDAKSYLGKEEKRVVMRRLTDIAVIYTIYGAGMEVYNVSLVAIEERSLRIALQRAALHYQTPNFPDVRVMEDVLLRRSVKEFLKAREKLEEEAAEEAEKKAKELANLEAKKKEEEKEAKDLADLEAKKKEDGKKKKDE